MNCQAPAASATTARISGPRRGGLAAGVERSPCQPLQRMHGDSRWRDDDAVWPGFRLWQRLPALGCLDQMLHRTYSVRIVRSAVSAAALIDRVEANLNRV